MAFENVNVESLKNSLYACKNNLSYNNSREIINTISSGNTWKAESSNHLKRALMTLVNERYKRLEDEINSYLSVAELISEYKNLETENKKMESELPGLRNNLYYTEWYPVTYYDIEGKPYEKWESEEVKDCNIERQINSLEDRIRENNNKMRNLETQVSKSV